MFREGLKMERQTLNHFENKAKKFDLKIKMHPVLSKERNYSHIPIKICGWK